MERADLPQRCLVGGGHRRQRYRGNPGQCSASFWWRGTGTGQRCIRPHASPPGCGAPGADPATRGRHQRHPHPRLDARHVGAQQVSLKPHNTPQRGAALLAALLTVTLVASMAAAALWRQWRNVEVESAERMQLQARWVLSGALDWARLILREDARAGGADHLAEPWAVPLAEARLSSFLASDANGTANETDSATQVFLSGQITDLQARMNVINLVDGAKVSETHLQAFSKLFEMLGLPREELTLLANNLLLAQDASADKAGAPLPPQRVEHLAR